MNDLAFPILQKGLPGTSLLRILPVTLNRFAESLTRTLGSLPSEQRNFESEGLHLIYRRHSDGPLFPLTLVGCSADREDVVYAHTPSLPGGFPLTLREVERALRFLQWDRNEESALSDAGLRVLLKAVTTGMLKGDACGAGRVMDELEWQSHMHTITQRGMHELVRIGSCIPVGQLNRSFSYHVGGPNHATREYFDVSSEACSRFGPHIHHGCKVLTAYGVAICIGVAVTADVPVPMLYWHPPGTSAARVAPFIHAVGNVVVGGQRVDHGGPVKDSSIVLSEERLSRYLNLSSDSPTDIDRTKWLNVGLFRLLPGAVVEPGFVSEGIGYDNERNALRLFLRNTANGEVVPFFPS